MLYFEVDNNLLVCEAGVSYSVRRDLLMFTGYLGYAKCESYCEQHQWYPPAITITKHGKKKPHSKLTAVLFATFLCMRA